MLKKPTYQFCLLGFVISQDQVCPELIGSLNGNYINDFWQFKPTSEANKNELGLISIFDRYGVLLQQIEPGPKGWDGILNWRPLPVPDYLCRTIFPKNNNIHRHFARKR